MSTIIQRARASGKCPPSLLRDDEDINFDSATVKVVDVNGKLYYSIVLMFCLSSTVLIYCYGCQLVLAVAVG